MKRLALILAAAVVLVAAGDASAALCTKCRGKAYIGSIGKCFKCAGHTSSGAFKLCKDCSGKMTRCQHCMAALGGAVPPTRRPPVKRPPVKAPVTLLALTVADNGKTITAGIGQRITVRLAGNITTGYSWSVTSLTGTAVRQEGKIRYTASPAPKGMVGSGGFSLATFKAFRNGRAVLTMGYKRPWEKKKPVRTFTVTIDVGPGTGRKADPVDPKGTDDGNGAAKDGKALSPKAAKLAKLFKDNIAKFSLDIRYVGPQNRPYYQLTLRIPRIKDRRQRFWPAAQLSPAGANKIIDHLAAEGFFDRAVDAARAGMARPKGPAYMLWLSGAPGVQLYENIRWYRPMLDRLDALAKVLDGDPAKQMDLLLGRLGTYRKRWPESAPKPKPPTPSRRR